MDTRNSLINFTLFVFLLAFSFVFSLLALSTPSVFYGVLALIGFIASIAGSVFNSFLAKQSGEAIYVWFTSFAVVTAILFIWYLTRCGTAFGWW